MAGYFGTEMQQALQRVVFEARGQIASTPGLANGGRYIMVEDPDRLGWPGIQAMLRDNGIVPFRFITPAQSTTYVTGLEQRGHRIDRSETYIADIARVEASIAPVLARGLPPGFTLAPPLLDPTEDAMREVQGFLAWHGIAPFCGSLLMDGPKQASVLLRDEAGEPAAFAHAYMPHNKFSPHRDHAWLGLVAVAPEVRGRGLGALVQALTLRRAIATFRADRIYAIVGPHHEASRRMVTAAGMEHDPALLASAVSQPALPRFSR